MTNKLVAYSYGTAAPVELADGVGECNVDNYYIFVDSDHKGLTVGECNIDKYYIFVERDQEGLTVGECDIDKYHIFVDRDQEGLTVARRATGGPIAILLYIYALLYNTVGTG